MLPACTPPREAQGGLHEGAPVSAPSLPLEVELLRQPQGTGDLKGLCPPPGTTTPRASKDSSFSTAQVAQGLS